MSEFHEGGPKFAPRELPPEEWAHSPWGDLHDLFFNEAAKDAVEKGYLDIQYDPDGNITKVVITEKGIEEQHNQIHRGREIGQVVKKGFLEAHGNGNGNGNGKNGKKDGNGRESERKRELFKVVMQFLNSDPRFKGRVVLVEKGIVFYTDKNKEEEELYLKGRDEEVLSHLLPYLNIKYGISHDQF